MRISVRFEMCIGHTLHNHPGRCRNLHGHNYICAIELEGEPFPETGMVVDFGDVKAEIRDPIDRLLDHHFLVHKDDPHAALLASLSPQRGVIVTPWLPTAENLALRIREMTETALEDIHARQHPDATPVSVASVTLMETENCGARV